MWSGAAGRRGLSSSLQSYSRPSDSDRESPWRPCSRTPCQRCTRLLQRTHNLLRSLFGRFLKTQNDAYVKRGGVMSLELQIPFSLGPSAVLFYYPSEGVWVIVPPFPYPPGTAHCPTLPKYILLCGFVHNTIYCALVLHNPQKLLLAEFLKQSTYFVKEDKDQDKI